MPGLRGDAEGRPGDAGDHRAHAAPRKRMFEDFGDAARALRESGCSDARVFAQCVDAQKNKEDLMAKKFAEAVKKAKETPLQRSPAAGLRSGSRPLWMVGGICPIQRQLFSRMKGLACCRAFPFDL